MEFLCTPSHAMTLLRIAVGEMEFTSKTPISIHELVVWLCVLETLLKVNILNN